MKENIDTSLKANDSESVAIILVIIYHDFP